MSRSECSAYPLGQVTREAISTAELLNASNGLPPPEAEVGAQPRKIGWQYRFPTLPIVLAISMLAFVFVPPASNNPRLSWTLVAIAAALTLWSLVLGVLGRRQQRVFTAEFLAVKAHYVQALVQGAIFLWWGYYWATAYFEIPLIITQVIFFYALDALLTWSRGRTWRVGFGPLPIVISTNLLLWFKHDVFFLQYLMLTTGAFAKQFITWQRDGRRTHIFNPSAFGQFVFATILILTGTTNEYTSGSDIAAQFEVPHMLLVIFLGGLIVQSLFQVTLMTAAAMFAIVVINEAYTAATGLYFFVNINVAAPIFLGLHLLITDPATSPRTNMGRVIFGGLYGIGYLILFRVLDLYEVPLFWDKLLPVPILNLCVPMIDRFVRAGMIGRINRAWETNLNPARMNLIHMTLWTAGFATMWTTGYLSAGDHPGNSIPFWKQAYEDGRPHAGHSLVIVAGAQAEGGGSGAAYNELGLICMEGRIIEQNRPLAAEYFAKACELGDESGCVNVVLQSIVFSEALSNESIAHAVDSLEADCMAGGNSRSCFLAGFTYERGRTGDRVIDKERAIELYERGAYDNLYAIKGLARIALSNDPPYDIRPMLNPIANAAEAGDAECYWYLAYMCHTGIGLNRSEPHTREFLERACALEMTDACDALSQPEVPQYIDPVMEMPGWATAFPLETQNAVSP